MTGERMKDLLFVFYDLTIVILENVQRHIHLLLQMEVLFYSISVTDYRSRES